MRARTRVGGITSFTLVASSLVCLGGPGAHAAEEDEASPPGPTEPDTAKAPEKRPAPPAEEPEAAPVPPAKPKPPAGISVDIDGWRVSLEGRVNTFLSYGWGNVLPQHAPEDGLSLVSGGGVDVQLQRDADGRFHTPRIRNGFLGNVLTLNVSRNLTDKTTMTAHFSLWSDIETNLQVYADAITWMQEGYLLLEGPWGSITAGRQLALFNRGAVEIDANYGHGYGLGFPCNFDYLHPTCGMIGFGVLFPFFRAGFLYTTPSFSGLTLAVGAYDPVIFAGKWERLITPTFEAELALTRPLGSFGMFKLFASALFQRLGATGNPVDPADPNSTPDTRAVAHKTVDAAGVSGGVRVELGPVRLGFAGHFGKGLGFAYALQDSEAAFYSATDTSDPRDGDLRDYQGFYGQVMVVAGRVDLMAGAGVSQLRLLPFDDSNTDHLPKQNLGYSAGAFLHLDDHLVLGLDYFGGQFTWWGTAFKQTVHAINTGLTMTF